MAVTVLRGLNRQKIIPTLVTLDADNAVFDADLPSDIEVICLNAKRVRYALPRLIKLIWKQRPEIVLSGLSHLNLALAIFRRFLPKDTKLLARETNVLSHRNQTLPFFRLRSFLYRRFLKNNDAIICQSRDMRDDLIENFQLPAHKLKLINNPLDMNFIEERVGSASSAQIADGSEIRLVSMGRLTEQKSFHIQLEAISMIDAHINLTLIGSGPELDDLRCKADQLKLSNRIHFAGFQKNPFKLMAKADAFIFSSRFEGFPNAILEALACSLPVISSPAPGGVREILERVEECIIAEDMTAKALAAAIEKWLGGKRSRVPSSAIDPYRSEKIVAAYEDVILGD